MTNEKAAAPNQTPVVRKRRWPRRLAIAGGVFIAIVAALLAFVSSGFFGKRIILPIAARQTGLTIAADTFKISPGLIPPGRVKIRNLSVAVGPEAGDRVLALPEADVDFSLYALLGGRLVITGGEVAGLDADVSDAKFERMNAAMEQAEAKGKPKSKAKDAPSSSQEKRDTTSQTGDSKRSESKPIIKPLPLEEWLAMLLDAPLRVDSLKVTEAHIRYAMASASGGAEITALEWPGINASISRFGYPGESAIVNVSGGELRCAMPDQAAASSAPSRLTIARPYFNIQIAQPSAGLDSATVTITTMDSNLGGLSGEMNGIAIAPLDVALPLTARLTSGAWTIDDLRIEASEAGRAEPILKAKASLTLKPAELDADFKLTYLDGAFLNAILGQHGQSTFTVEGVASNAAVHVDLATLNANWTVDKTVTDFMAAIPAQPDLQFKPVDVEFKNTGSWRAADALITLDSLDLLVREGERVVAEGRLTGPMALPLKDFKAGGEKPFLDSSLTLQINQLDLAQLNPLVALFINGEIGGAISSTLDIKTEQASRQATVAGKFRWDKAVARAPFFELAGAGRRSYAGEIALAARMDMSAELKTLTVEIQEDGRALASFALSGRFAPGEEATIRLNARVPAAADGSPIALALVQGRPASVRAMAAEVDGTFDMRQMKSGLTARGRLIAPIPVSASSAAAQDVDCIYDMQIEQQGQEWTLNLKNTKIALLEKSQPLMTATAGADFRLIADFDARPSLRGTAQLNVDQIDDRLLASFMGGEAPTADQTSVPSHASASSALSFAATRSSSSSPIPPKSLTALASQPANLPSTPAAASVAAPASAVDIAWPVFDWKEFDLVLKATLGRGSIMGHTLDRVEITTTIKPHPAQSAPQQSAFLIESAVRGARLTSEYLALTDFTITSATPLSYTSAGQIRADDMTLDFRNSGQPAVAAAARAAFNMADESGSLDITSASLHPAAWALAPGFAVPPSLREAAAQATASVRFAKLGADGSLTYSAKITGLQPQIVTSGEPTAPPDAAGVLMQSEGAAAWADWGETISSDKFSGAIEARGRRLAEAALKKPLRIERRGDDWTQWLRGGAQFEARMDDLDLSLWNDLVKPFDLGEGRGIIGGRMNLDVADGMKAMTAIGNFSLKDAAWVADGWNISAQAPLSGAGDFDLAVMAMRDLAIKKCEGRLADAAGNTLTFAASGQWNLEKGGAINLDVSSRAGAPGKSWSPIALEGLAPGWTAMDVKIRSNLDAATGQTRGQLTWNVSGFQHGMNNPMIDKTAHSLDATGAADFTMSAAEAALTLTQSDLLLHPQPQPGVATAPSSGKLSVTGRLAAVLPIGQVPRITGAFDLRGSDIALQLHQPPAVTESLDDLIKEEERREREKAAAKSPAPPALDPAATPTSPLPFDLGGIDVTWKGEFTNLAIIPMKFPSASFNGGIKNSVFATSFAAAAAPKGEIAGSIGADFTRPAPAFQKKLSVKDIPADQLASALYPFLHNRIQGNLFCDVELAASGWDAAAIMPTLDGKITFQARDGQLKNVKMLDELVRVTGFKELNVMKFFTAQGDIVIRQGRMTINFMDYKGEFQKMGVDGLIDMRRLDSMPIDLKLRLALGAPLITKLGQRASFTRLTDADGYLKIPTLIGMTGTINAPKPTISTGGLIRDVKDGGLDFLRALVEREAGLAPADAPQTAAPPVPTPATAGPIPSSAPTPAPTPPSAPAPSPTPDTRSNKEKRRDEAIGIGIELLDGYLKQKNEK